MNNRPIPLNRVTLTGEEIAFATQAIQSGNISGGGSFTKKCQELLEDQLRLPKVLLTTSCTHALEMCALLLDLNPGDEVIVPSFTFVSTANAFALRGARPVFADIRPDTLNIDESRLEGHISSRTRAIVVVHYAGVACEMDPIMEIAERHHLPVIEDNAHALFGKYRGRYLGTFGCLSTQSFHETKNFTCGEGGALLINDPEYVERAEILIEKGTNRSRFFRGQVDKYTWVDLGSSYVLSDILAAFLYAQLQAREEIQAQRQRLWMAYYDALHDWCAAHDVALPVVPPWCDSAYHAFYLIFPSLGIRQAMIRHLKEQGVSGTFHFLPLHLSPMGRSFGGKAGDCPVTESVSDRLLRLPLFGSLTPAAQGKVIDTILCFQEPAPHPRSLVAGSAMR